MTGRVCGDDARFGGGGEAVELGLAHAQRGHEHDHVPKLPEECPVFAGGFAGLPAPLLMRGVVSAGRLVGNKLDPRHQANTLLLCR